MPPSRSIFARDTTESTILLPVLLPLLLVPIAIILIFTLVKAFKFSKTDQRPRQPTVWPASRYRGQMPWFSDRLPRHQRGPPVPGRDYCPGLGRRLGGFSRGRRPLQGRHRHLSGYGEMPSPRRTYDMARMPIEASRRAIMGHPRWLANPAALGRANNFGSGDNLNALGRQEMVRAAPLLQRPRRARRPSSSGLSSSDSSLSVRGLGMRRNHGVRPIHRTRGPPPPNYARQRPPPLHEHMGPPRAYNARQPLGRRYRPHGGGHMGGAGAVDLPMRHPRNVYHSETSSDKTEFDSSENEYSESGFGSYHDPSSYTGHFAESSSDSDRYDRRYNGRAGRVGGPNPRDPFRTGRRLGSDESTYSDRYGGYRGNSSDAYD